MYVWGGVSPAAMFFEAEEITAMSLYISLGIAQRSATVTSSSVYLPTNFLVSFESFFSTYGIPKENLLINYRGYLFIF